MNMLYARLENELLRKDFNNFEMQDKNDLVAHIANKKGLMYYQVDEKAVLAFHKELKMRIFSEQCEEEIIAGFTASNGHTYQTNRDDQLNMIGTKLLVENDRAKETVNWKTEDEGYVTHSREDWLKVYDEAQKHKESKLMKYDRLKTKIKQADTHETLLTIKWEENENE